MANSKRSSTDGGGRTNPSFGVGHSERNEEATTHPSPGEPPVHDPGGSSVSKWFPGLTTSYKEGRTVPFVEPAVDVKRVWEHDRLLRLWAVAPRLYDAAVASASDHTVEECNVTTMEKRETHDPPAFVRWIERTDPCIWHALLREIDG